MGQSRIGLERPRQHTYRVGECEHTYKARWIRQLQSLGLKYEIEVLEAVSSPDELNSAEMYWIANGRKWGWPLTNATDGGDGCVMPRTAEHNRKISEAQKGEKAFWFGKKFDAETRIKKSVSMGGRPVRDSEGRVYSCPAEAAIKLGLNPDRVAKAARTGGMVGCGKGRKQPGIRFQYVDNNAVSME